MVPDSLGRSPLSHNNKTSVMEAFCKLLDELDDLAFAAASRLQWNRGSVKNLAVMGMLLLLTPPQANASPMVDPSPNAGALALLGLGIAGLLRIGHAS
jgi:MYXO-CTERM domain-containing protein